MIHQTKTNFNEFKANVLKCLQESCPSKGHFSELEAEIQRIQAAFANQSLELVELKRQNKLQSVSLE
jgi:hypothetical protein